MHDKVINASYMWNYFLDHLQLDNEILKMNDRGKMKKYVKQMYKTKYKGTTSDYWIDFLVLLTRLFVYIDS
jgi:hypothetical protein